MLKCLCVGCTLAGEGRIGREIKLPCFGEQSLGKEVRGIGVCVLCCVSMCVLCCVSMCVLCCVVLCVCVHMCMCACADMPVAVHTCLYDHVHCNVNKCVNKQRRGEGICKERVCMYGK